MNFPKNPIEPPGAARASPVFGASGSPRRARQQRRSMGSMGSWCQGKMKMDMDVGQNGRPRGPQMLV